MISMKNVQYIQCEDIEVLRFSNTKSSMLYNLVTVEEAVWVILDEFIRQHNSSRM